MTTILSITAHEEPLSIIDLCLNSIIVGEFDAVVVHINARSNINVQTLISLIQKTDILKGKVLINPMRLSLPFLVKTQAPHTPVLHRAHISNYFYAKNVLGPIDKYCLDSSNSLLIKPGVKNYIQQARAGVELITLTKNRAWYEQVSNDILAQPDGTRIRISQHEGSFYAGDIFDKICAFICAYEHSNTMAGISDSELPEFPREETLFPTAYAELGSQNPVLPYIYIPWETDATWKLEDVIAILNGKELPANKFGIKRVPRDINDPVRIAIGTHYGYRQMMMEAVVAA